MGVKISGVSNTIEHSKASKEEKIKGKVSTARETKENDISN
jgi:hypothetical protein